MSTAQYWFTLFWEFAPAILLLIGIGFGLGWWIRSLRWVRGWIRDRALKRWNAEAKDAMLDSVLARCGVEIAEEKSANNKPIGDQGAEESDADREVFPVEKAQAERGPAQSEADKKAMTPEREAQIHCDLESVADDLAMSDHRGERLLRDGYSELKEEMDRLKAQLVESERIRKGYEKYVPFANREGYRLDQSEDLAVKERGE